MLARDAVSVKEGELHIAFEWRKPDKGKNQKNLNADAELAILEAAPAEWLEALRAAAPCEKDSARTILRKHLNIFTAKNTFDYFIHKDLGGFLRRELDFYIKSEVIDLAHLDALDESVASGWLARVRALRMVGHKLIDFMAAVENFQKRLWEKKKFVLRTDYCVTLCHLPDESLYEAIAVCTKQWQEWRELNFCDATTAAAGKEIRMAFLREHPTLPVDTANFPPSFKDALLSLFDDIDGACGGIMFHGDNWQVLNMIQNRFIEAIKCVYIDPPYNTDMAPIAYKNNYRHSSWLSLINGSMPIVKRLMGYESALAVAIDDAELCHLKLLLDNSFGEESRIGTVVVQSNPGGRDINSHFAISHEYCLFYANKGQKEIILPRAEGYNEKNIAGFRRGGGLSSPEERPNSEFAIYYDSSTLRIIGVGGKNMEYFPAPYRPSSVFFYDAAGEIVEDTLDSFMSKFPQAVSLLPQFKKTGERGVWRWSDRKKIMGAILDGRIYIRASKTGPVVELSSTQSSYYKPKTIWGDAMFSATAHRTNLLTDIFGSKHLFSYPKSIHTVTTTVGKMLFDESENNYSFARAEKSIQALSLQKEEFIVLDYFAGSGTTGHAVINLNRQDGVNRKFILAEMGEYFCSVLLPRIKKIIYCPKWRSGFPHPNYDLSAHDISGSPKLIKYQSIESYDDALANLKKPGHALSSVEEDLIQKDGAIREDYMLHYLFDVDANDGVPLLGNEDFSHPFSSCLNITRDDVVRAEVVDFPETFNYLLGVHVKTRRWVDGVLVIAGEMRNGDKTLILWRDLAAMSSDALNVWLEKSQLLGDDLDAVYVNGDHLVEELRGEGARWRVARIEAVFRRLMFED